MNRPFVSFNKPSMKMDGLLLLTWPEKPSKGFHDRMKKYSIDNSKRRASSCSP